MALIQGAETGTRNGPAAAALGAALRALLWTLLRALLPLAVTGLAACAALDKRAIDERDVPPLHVAGARYTLADARARPSPEVLALNDEMRDFVRRYTRDASNGYSALQSLHMAIKSPGGLAMRYEPFADGDARDAFNRGAANCLSYAHLFIALAREAGLKARYQWMELRPEWHRVGQRVFVRLHVNVQVKTRDANEYMVDIDPLSRSALVGARLMSDAEGLALYHNNQAIRALSDDRPAEAWLHVVKGLEAAPRLSPLWVNLGAIYRYTAQYAEAERAYLKALEVDGGERSAMNNLVYLYGQQQRKREAAYWLDRLSRHRERNPYYHASLGDRAMQEQDWDTAYKHYRKARGLQPEDGRLIYNLGLAEHYRGNARMAEKLIAQAIEKAPFRVEKERYRVHFDSIRRQRAAGRTAFAAQTP